MLVTCVLKLLFIIVNCYSIKAGMYILDIMDNYVIKHFQNVKLKAVVWEKKETCWVSAHYESVFWAFSILHPKAQLPDFLPHEMTHFLTSKILPSPNNHFQNNPLKCRLREGEVVNKIVSITRFWVCGKIHCTPLFDIHYKLTLAWLKQLHTLNVVTW